MQNHKVRYTDPLILSVVFIGLILTFGAFWMSRAIEHRQIENAFVHMMDRYEASIKRELELNLEVLLALKTLFVTDHLLNRDDFSKTSRLFLKRHPSIQALEWIPEVNQSERETYEHRAQKEGFRDFTFTQRHAQGKMIPALLKERYYPVYYVEPMVGNALVLGFDLSSDPIRRNALEHAKRLGSLHTTPPIHLVQDQKETLGFIALVPIYENETLLEGFRGFLGGAYRLSDLVSEAFKHESNARSFNMVITDVSDKKPMTLFAFETAESDKRFEFTSYFSVGVRQWEIKAWPHRQFIEGFETFFTYFVVIFGVGFFLLIGYVIALRTQRTERLNDYNQDLTHQVTKKTEALSRLNANLEGRVQEAVRKNLEQEHMMTIQARQAAMGEMIGMIAHQWRQPLTAMSMMADNVLVDFEMGQERSENIIETLELVQTQVTYLSKTIDDFRDFFRKDKERERISTEILIEESLGLIGRTLESHDIEIHIDIKHNIHVNIYRNEVIQVLLNLFKNADDAFTKEQTERWIDVVVDKTESEAIIEINDNAGGVAKEVIAHIFEPYYSTKEAKNGTGLGLYMSKIIIEEHHLGTLSVQNKGKGASFRVVLPL